MGLGNIDFSAVVVRKRGVATEINEMKRMALKEARRLAQSAQAIYQAVEFDDFSGVVDEAKQFKIAVEGLVTRAEKISAMKKLTYKR